MDSKKKNLGILAGIAFSLIICYSIQYFFMKPSFDKVMMQAASELNKTCPVMMDRETRFDNAVALTRNTFQYNYTLINVSRSQIDTDIIKKNIEPGIVNNVKTNPSMKIFRDNKATLAYNYKDKNGNDIMTLFITPDKYLKE